MLLSLSIQNLALIEKLTLDFKPQFTTLTGETGAGKSILLDALGLALGNRADSGLVRHGTERADVCAEFDLTHLPQVKQWLANNDLDDEDQCLLRRTLTAEGRSKAFINGIAATTAQLKQLASLLIDIHGQQEHQTLLKADKQLELLDLYAQHANLCESTAQNYQAWSKLNHQLHTLQTQQADRHAKIALLQFQLKEFDAVAPQADEFEALSQTQQTLSHANEIQQASLQAYELLEGETGISHQLTQVAHALSQAAPYNPSLANCLEQINSLLIDAQEVASDIHDQSESVELDPQKLMQVDDRLSTLFALSKKYHLDPEQLAAHHQTLQAQLDELLDSDATLDALQTQITQAWQQFEQAASALSASRQQAAQKLSNSVTEAMHTLGMPNGQFQIQLSQAAKASKHGLDQVSLWVTANKGQPLQLLAKVASGGELSRISLAIQVASAEVASLPTLIFDEVDVGIGGGTAEVVGQKMRQIGAHRQVFAITHLAQVAAHGNQHFCIAKTSDQQSTTTQVRALTNDKRIEELARMLGGVTITPHTLNHAEEMFNKAQQA